MSKELKTIDAFGDNSTSNNSTIQKDALKDSDLTYDQKFKQLFMKKEFLTPILKNIVPEYKYCPLETIEALINPHGDTRVNPSVYDSEDCGKGEETVTRYDVLVDCALPGGAEVCVDLFFDLEMQRENKPGYPIPKRGVYYCCRLISRQIEALGEESYNQLKPVYSVWILINDIPKEFENSVYTAGLSGSFNNCNTSASQLNEQIDLIHLSLIYLSEDFKVEEDQDDLIKYLQSVFTKQVGNPEVNPYYEYSSRIEEEVDEMMSIRESFEQRGRAKGRAEGMIAILLEEGRTKSEIIRYLITMKRNPLTREQAEEALQNFLEENQ